jgi:hypothetical protein
MKSAVHLVSLLLVAAVATGCDSPRSELDAHQLTEAIKSLASLSAEAELLARQWTTGDVTRAFTLVHQDALEQESLKLSKQLGKPVPDALRPAHQRAVALNGRLQAGLVQVAKAAAQPGQLAQLRQEFHSIKTDAKALEHQP